MPAESLPCCSAPRSSCQEERLLDLRHQSAPPSSPEDSLAGAGGPPKGSEVEALSSEELYCRHCLAASRARQRTSAIRASGVGSWESKIWPRASRAFRGAATLRSPPDIGTATDTWFGDVVDNVRRAMTDDLEPCHQAGLVWPTVASAATASSTRRLSQRGTQSLFIKRARNVKTGAVRRWRSDLSAGDLKPARYASRSAERARVLRHYARTWRKTRGAPRSSCQVLRHLRAHQSAPPSSPEGSLAGAGGPPNGSEVEA